MTVWQYTAIDPGGEAGSRKRTRGELSGDSAADVRAQLRRIGLQVIDLRSVRRSHADRAANTRWRTSIIAPLGAAWRGHLRQRRRMERAELFDSLATMINSGLPLLGAVETILESSTGRSRTRRSMLVQVRERLRGGGSLAAAMREHSAWFDAVEVAMIEAGQHGGTLPEVLLRLSQRHERAGGLQQKLLGALTYPALVSMVGLGVIVFLSVKTLPELTRILTDADIAIPALTTRVMSLGRFIAGFWWLILSMAAFTTLGWMLVSHSSIARSIPVPQWIAARRPRLLVLKRLRIAAAARQLSDLLRSGVPMVEALRTIAPAAASRSLRHTLELAADRIERGDELAGALDDPHWFDAEFRQLLAIGQASGELDDLLLRIAERYERQSQRLIDRLTSILEPAVIMLLALGVGTVVMSAILPLLRLQEIL